ncbi:hypothetical protein TNCV_4066541 [Trichonephila clavipes]|uniref:Uncharacterized protein n=1 Tax=Trichonephila clavipes TaxID=2585209 RepID=A0A8X6W9L2_TRICX|nr:hypothetical protein TNCV_4066541 [Trichonephila clavipes]
MAKARDVSTEKDDDSGVPNDKAGYRSGPMLSYQKIPGSTCSILMTVYAARGVEETVGCMLAFEIDLGTPHLVWWFGKTLDTRHAHL